MCGCYLLDAAEMTKAHAKSWRNMLEWAFGNFELFVKKKAGSGV